MRELVARGELGARSGRGFYERGEPRAGGAGEPGESSVAGDADADGGSSSVCGVVIRRGLPGARGGRRRRARIDVALAAGAGLARPFAAADAAGASTSCSSACERRGEWGEASSRR